MDDLSMECDIEDDPIKKFLLHKLNNIRLNNSELEEQITRRKELLNECLTNAASEFGQNVLEIVSTWQRTMTNKWIIGIRLKNTSSTKLVQNIDLLLRWDSPTTLTYKIKTFTRYKTQHVQKTTLPESLDKIIKHMESIDYQNERFADGEWICSDEVNKHVIIVAMFSIPEFVAKTSYNISGVLKYKFKEKDCQLNIPNFYVSVKDVISENIAIKDFDIQNGEEETFLSTLTANEQYEFIIRIPRDSYSSLENIFEVECMLKKVDVVSAVKTWFFKNGITPDNSGFLLFIEKETDWIYNLNVFTQNQSKLHLFLHFLYQNISNIIILPIKYKQIIKDIPEGSNMLYEEVDEEKLRITLRDFGKSLESQIELVEKFCNKSFEEIPGDIVKQKDQVGLNITMENYQKFRMELTELEFASDSLYSEIEKHTTKNKCIVEENN